MCAGRVAYFNGNGVLGGEARGVCVGAGVGHDGGVGVDERHVGFARWRHCVVCVCADGIGLRWAICGTRSGDVGWSSLEAPRRKRVCPTTRVKWFGCFTRSAQKVGILIFRKYTHLWIER